MELQDFQKAFGHHQPTLLGARALFAVLVPLVETEEGLSLLYEVRSAGLRYHALEVCFPGGRMEPGETPEVCALRETFEELQIPASAIHTIGPLDFLYLRSEALMFPILAQIDAPALKAMRLNPAEVTHTFTVPVSFFESHQPTVYRYTLEPAVEDFPYEQVQIPSDYTWMSGTMEVPVYQGLPHPLWGMTARITDGLFRALRL